MWHTEPYKSSASRHLQAICGTSFPSSLVKKTMREAYKFKAWYKCLTYIGLASFNKIS